MKKEVIHKGYTLTQNNRGRWEALEFKTPGEANACLSAPTQGMLKTLIERRLAIRAVQEKTNV